MLLDFFHKIISTKRLLHHREYGEANKKNHNQKKFLSFYHRKSQTVGRTVKIQKGKNVLLLVPPNFFLSQMLSYWCFLQKISQASELLLSVSLNFRTVYSLQKCGLSYKSNLGLYWMLVKPQDKSKSGLSI